MQLRIDPEMTELVVRAGLKALHLLPEKAVDQCEVDLYRVQENRKHNSTGKDAVGVTIHIRPEDL